MIELMAVVAMSFLIISVLTKIYLSMHQLLLAQQQLQSQQKTAQKVMSVIEDELLRAGHIGCARLSTDFNVYPYMSQTLTAENFLVVTNDTLSVRYQAFPGVQLRKNTDEHLWLIVDSVEKYYPNQYLVISDCRHAEIFEVAAVKMAAGEQYIMPRTSLHFAYQRYAEIGRLVNRQYRVESIHGKSQFIRVDVSEKKESVAEGVEGLQFERDQHGIRYQVVTLLNGVSKHWYGYANIGNQV